MPTSRKLLLSAVVLVAVAVAVLWFLSLETDIGWLHVAGLGMSVLLLGLIWFWPGRKEQQPTRPPP